MPEYSPINGRKKLFQRQIPTVLGLIVLVIGLALGIFFFKDGFKGFAPRATPQTTPKAIKITNVLDSSFSVSFLTDEATTGFVKYGTSATDLKSQASDDRDQLSGSVSSYLSHQITIRGLSPNTSYYFVLGTGSGSEFDNQGAPFTQKTGAAVTDTTGAKTIYGNVVNVTGGPAEGALVYVKADSTGELSAIVKSSGSWVIPLNTARTLDGSAIAPLTDDTNVSISVQGVTESLSAQIQTTVGQAQPVQTITLGGNNDVSQASPSPTDAAGSASTATAQANVATNSADTTGASTASDSATFTDNSNDLSNLPSDNQTLSNLDSLSHDISGSNSSLAANSSTVDLTKTQPQTVETTQPVISGKAAPNVTVSISVHSATQITQQLQADSSGNFSLDIARLSQNLEPGQHTVTYSYTDPSTGQTVTKTQTFTVADNSSAGSDITLSDGSTANELALANTNGADSSTATSSTAGKTAAPFGSGNPVPVAVTPTPTPSFIPDTSSSSASRSGRTSQPATGSGIPVSGSTSTTIALIVGGIFFVLAGAWSFWVAQHLPINNQEED